MKKIFFILFICVFSNMNAQKIGVLAGFTSQRFDIDGIDSESESGFHIGAFTNFSLSEKIGLQPELTFSSVDDLSMLSLNGIFTYLLSDSFKLQFGPQFGLARGDEIDLLDDLLGDDFTKFNFQLAIGLGYNISNNLMVQIRYGLQLNDHIKDVDVGGIKISTISVGLGYKF